MEKIFAPPREAADFFGLSETNFRRRYIITGRIPLYDLGGRAPVVKVAEAGAVIEQDCAAQRADPSLKKTRNAGGARNPWGRKGKPKKMGKRLAQP